MAVQTEYLNNLRPGLAGQVSSMYPASFISRNVEAAAGIGFGVAVAQGDDDYGVVAFADNSARGFVGITVRERSLNAETPNLFAENDSARILTKGPIWVEVPGAVSAGQPVYVNNTTGAFTATSGGGTAIPGGRFDTSAPDGGIALVRIV